MGGRSISPMCNIRVCIPKLKKSKSGKEDEDGMLLIASLPVCHLPNQWTCRLYDEGELILPSVTFFPSNIDGLNVVSYTSCHQYHQVPV